MGLFDIFKKKESSKADNDTTCNHSDALPNSVFCPKCGHKIVGEQSDDGYLRITCTRCKASMVSKQKSRKENVIVLINPKAV